MLRKSVEKIQLALLIVDK